MELTIQETLDLMAAHALDGLLMAANALDGLLSSYAGMPLPDPSIAAKAAYDYAAAMMVERARRDERGVVTEESNA